MPIYVYTYIGMVYSACVFVYRVFVVVCCYDDEKRVSEAS